MKTQNWYDIGFKAAVNGYKAQPPKNYWLALDYFAGYDTGARG